MYNLAPVLAGANNLASINEDDVTNTGTAVSALLSGRVTDDAGDPQGIAVTATDSANGTWQYSTDGGTSWTDVGAVSNGSALLLTAAARVRFVPAADFNGPVQNAITFGAWDQFTGTAGTKVDPGAGGGETAFSAAAASSNLTVTPVNDVPAAAASRVTTAEDTPRAFAAADFGFTDAEGDPLASVTIQSLSLAPGDTLRLSGADVAAGATIAAADLPSLVYAPAPDRSGAARSAFAFTANDADPGAVAATMTIDVTPVDDPPVLDPIADRRVRFGDTLRLAVTASDPDAGPLRFSLVAPPAGAAIDPATGLLTYRPARPGLAPVLTVRVTDPQGSFDEKSFAVTVGNGPGQSETSQYEVSGGPGETRVVVADATGDGVPDRITATGPGGSVLVAVIDGATGAVVRTLSPFEPTFAGGANLAADDVNGDGVADIAVGADDLGGPRVVVYDGATGAVLADFLGIDDPNFRGGVRVALGDVDGDGLADLIVAAGTGGGPRVAVYAGASLRPGREPAKLADDFFAFEPTLRDGAYVSAGDVNGDGRADLIFGGGPGGGPRVRIWDSRPFFLSGGRTVDPLADFFASDSPSAGGVRVAAKDLDGDEFRDLIASVPAGSSSTVKVYLGKDMTPRDTPPVFAEFDAGLNGTYVG